MSTSPSRMPASRNLTEPHRLASRTPLLFLPVVLETRFIDLTSGGSELWVRVFPDQISIDSHEPELTKQEIADGQAYWNAVWAAGNPPAVDGVKTPWRDLASRYGAQRAAWIARQMTPANLDQQPAIPASTASLTLTFGSTPIIFTCSRYGAAGNNVQIKIDASAPRSKPVVVDHNLVTIYAKWDGTLHTTADIARYFPSSKTDDGGAITVSVGNAAQVLTATVPTNLTGGADPAPAPLFPSPPQRSTSWEKPAIAAALPDSWTVVLISGKQTISFQSKQPVQLDLAMSLNPHGGPFPPGSPVDSGLQWLVDFDAALDAGMALKIPISSQQRSAGFDRIFVYGLRSRDSSGSDTLADLLDAHHYTDGFALVPQGSPTNNTPDASSAYSRKDPDYATSFVVERQGPLIKSPKDQPERDGNRFATFVGFDPSRMTNIQYSDSTGSRNGSDMLAALWPSTLGYFLSQVMAPAFTAEQIESAREYALAYAVSRGPIASFRVGRTPYGVLPMTSIAKYKLNVDDGSTPGEQKLVNLVRQLWTNWLLSSDGAPHMQKTGDPDKELGLVLGMDASSMSFRGRQVLGSEFLWNYMAFTGMHSSDMDAWWALQTKSGRDLFDSYGYQTWDPRAIHLGLSPNSFPVLYPTVQTGPLSETEPLAADADLGNNTKVNYIQWLQKASVDDIQKENYPGPRPTALLYKILRQSLILEYAKLAAAAEITAGRLDPAQTRESELIGMGRTETRRSVVPSTVGTPREPVSVWDVLDRPVDPNAIKKEKWSEYLVRIAPQPNSPLPELNDLYSSMARLAVLPTAELDRLLTETLDAGSHRLDVWATAIATAILTRARSRGIAGVHLASYGWVENVWPASKRPTVQGGELNQVKTLDAKRAILLKKASTPIPPLQPQVDNGGFIYAPSQDQAAVAAILRSGYMSHKGTGDEPALSMDLSSERVRGALMLLDGVRQGQSLNVLLGYLFESGLHDVKLDKYIQPFRNLFPMAANQATPSTPSTGGMAPSNVVDGLALRTAWDDGQLAAGDDWGTGLPGSYQSRDQNAIIQLLQTIDGYADALGELSIAEAIFQTVRGNFERSGGLMAAISKGQRPPDPEVLNTPRGGLDIVHRAALIFAGALPANAWQQNYARARAAAEPWLDAWLSLVLPDPSTVNVSCTVTFRDKQLGNGNKPVSLADLKLAPLDCIAMAEGSTQAAQRSELENRILYSAGVPYTADPNSVTITYAPTSSTALSFPDLLYLWKTFRMFINAARPLTPQDMAVPDKKVPNSDTLVDLPRLRARAKAALGMFNKNWNDLKDSIDGAANALSLPDALMACSFYGIPGSVPYSNSPVDPRLTDQATYISNALGDRYNRAAGLINDTASLGDLVTAFQAIFGNDFMVLPGFFPPDKQGLKDAFAKTLVPPDSAEPSRWLTQLTYVRPAIARLDTAFDIAQVVSGWARPNLQLAQLPSVPDDQWLALPWDPDKPPSNGRVALACFAQGNPSTDDIQAGLLIDEWLDKVPSPEEKAAVVFHYEEPNARAPHALLLGVCPDNREFWDDDLVTAILQEALQLVKIRTVDLDSVQKVGQILPALYFPLNLQGATISANFAFLKESSGANPQLG